jgi:F0F1-type ATP synthase membrane subunit a
VRCRNEHAEEVNVLALTALLFLLVLTVIGLPTWPYSARWTYYPSSACGVTALTMALLIVLGFL